MKKELLIFGAVVVLCLGVTAFALIKPKAKPTSTDTDDSSTSLADAGSSTTTTGSGSTDFNFSTGTSGTSGTGTPGSMGTSDGFSTGSSQYPPPADLNPNRPFDTTGTQPAGNPFPGSTGTTGTTSPFGTTGTTGSTGTAPGTFGTTGTSGTTSPFGTTGTTGTTTSSFDPLPTTTTVDTASTETRTHVVKKGEILGDISRKYYGTSKHWRKIADANQVREDGLKEGMKLTIPPLPASTSTTSTSTATDTAATGDAGTYVVKKGDSYYKIAKRELGDASRYKEIERLNGIPAEDLREGTKLKMPSKAGGLDATATTGGPELPAGSRTHVVAEGEYLSDISKKYYGSTKHWQLIVSANPGVTPERLKVGQKLVIPERAGSSSSATGTGSSDTAVSADEYVVKKGDTFEVIAGKTLGDKRKWKKIQDVNPGVDPSALKIGQKIKLPAGATGEAPAIPAPSTELPGSTYPSTSPSFPSTPSTFPATSPTAPSTTPGSSSIPAPTTTPSDPWSTMPAPVSTGTGTTGSTGAGTTTTTPSSTYSDPWKDFSTPTTGTGGSSTTGSSTLPPP